MRHLSSIFALNKRARCGLPKPTGDEEALKENKIIQAMHVTCIMHALEKMEELKF